MHPLLGSNSTFFDGFQLYDRHNRYGTDQAASTYDALIKIKPSERPFILSRDSAPGAGQFSASWTGTVQWSITNLSNMQCCNI